MIELRWDGAVEQKVRQRLREALLRGVLLLHNRARVLCSKPARRVTRRSGNRTRTEYIPSRPGEPPALRTGFGRSSITFWEEGPLHFQVGIRQNGIYMAYLELGTRYIAPRPWLSRALQETRDAILALVRSAAGTV